MARRLSLLVASLQLARIGLVLTAVSNIWLVMWLGRGPAGGGLQTWAALATTAAVAVGMYIFGMTLNDLMDARRDRVLAPDRPLPSRRIRPATAMALAVAALLVAVAGSVPLGAVSTLLCLVTATMVLFYNGPGKHITGVGILTLGLIRAAHMLIAAPGLMYLWPVWLTMTHVVGLSAACHRLEGKRPWLTGAHVWTVTLGWAFVSVVAIGWMMHQESLTMPGRPWIWAGPVAAMAGFVAVALRTVWSAPTPQAAGGLLMKRGLIWLIVYDACWLAGAGLWGPAAVSATMLPATWLLMVIVRQLKTLSEGPVTFQR
jgi:hypothetical protein